MRECAKCSCQDVQWVDFVSKAGNNVKGWKCQNKKCGNLVFADSGKKRNGNPTQAPTTQQSGVTLEIINNKLDSILIHLGITTQKLDVRTDDEAPF